MENFDTKPSGNEVISKVKHVSFFQRITHARITQPQLTIKINPKKNPEKLCSSMSFVVRLVFNCVDKIHMPAMY